MSGRSDSEQRAGLKPVKTAVELINAHFLDARRSLLETAAFLDRVERAEGGPEALENDPRLARLREACRFLTDSEGRRAERFLTLFSK